MLGSAHFCFCAFVLRITQGKTFILSRQYPYEPRFVRKLKFLKEEVTHKAIAQQAICCVFLFSLSNFPMVRWVSGLFSLWHPLSSVDRYPRSKHSIAIPIDTWSILDQHLSWYSINTPSTSRSTVLVLIKGVRTGIFLRMRAWVPCLPPYPD